MDSPPLPDKFLISSLFPMPTLPPITLPPVHIPQGKVTFMWENRYRQEELHLFTTKSPNLPVSLHLLCVFPAFMVEGEAVDCAPSCLSVITLVILVSVSAVTSFSCSPVTFPPANVHALLLVFQFFFLHFPSATTYFSAAFHSRTYKKSCINTLTFIHFSAHFSPQVWRPPSSAFHWKWLLTVTDVFKPMNNVMVSSQHHSARSTYLSIEVFFLLALVAPHSVGSYSVPPAPLPAIPFWVSLLAPPPSIGSELLVYLDPRLASLASLGVSSRSMLFGTILFPATNYN